MAMSSDFQELSDLCHDTAYFRILKMHFEELDGCPLVKHSSAWSKHININKLPKLRVSQFSPLIPGGPRYDCVLAALVDSQLPPRHQ